MNVIVCCLIIVPLLAFLFELTQMLKAKREAENGGVCKKNSTTFEVNGYFAVLAVAVFSTVIYSALETVIAVNNCGFDAPEKLKTAFVIAFVCNAVICVFKGTVCERSIKKGVLYDSGSVVKCVLKVMALDLLAVAVLVYFMLAIAGVV